MHPAKVFLIFNCLILTSCHDGGLEIKATQEGDVFNVTLINDSDRVVEIFGKGQLGVPPGMKPGSIQWNISKAGVELHQCVLVSHNPGYLRIYPKSKGRVSIEKSLLERFFCIQEGPYNVRACYVGEMGGCSNIVRAVAPPR